MTTLVVFVSSSKLAEFLYVPFISIEKHHPVFCFTGLLFVFEILCMQTTFSFPRCIFWRSIVKLKRKETFCFAKGWSDYNTIFLTAASLAQVDNAPNEADSNLFCRDTRGLDSRSVKSFVFVLFLFFFQKPSLCLGNRIAVFTVRVWMICFLAAIVTSAFGTQSIDYFDNTNSELTC